MSHFIVSGPSGHLVLPLLCSTYSVEYRGRQLLVLLQSGSANTGGHLRDFTPLTVQRPASAGSTRGAGRNQALDLNQSIRLRISLLLAE